MSKTYTRKVHQGQVAKAEAVREKKRQEDAKAEQKEAESWAEGAKGPTAYELKKQREAERLERIKKLHELHDQELEELSKGKK